MKNHPGHYWICFWLALILLFGDHDTTREVRHVDESLARVSATLDRIDAKLGVLLERTK